MSKVFNAFVNELSEKSGCDWDFLVAMYNHINNKYGDVDWKRFENGVMKRDWSIRNKFDYNFSRFENVLVKLCEQTSCTYNYLFGLFTDMVYDPNDDGDWEYFASVSMEHDW